MGIYIGLLFATILVLDSNCQRTVGHFYPIFFLFIFMVKGSMEFLDKGVDVKPCEGCKYSKLRFGELRCKRPKKAWDLTVVGKKCKVKESM